MTGGEWSALKRGPTAPGADDLISILTSDDETSGKGRIRCPKCGWRPEAGDLWMCNCGCFWHTFDTGGRCPDCGRQWLHTQCKACHEWSPHQDWYA